MKILISGDRKWQDLGLIKEILEGFKSDTTTSVVLCYIDFVIFIPVANDLGLTVEKCDDSLTGIDYLLIFHKYIRGSVRSKLLIKDASRKNIPYQIVGSSF